MTGGRPELGDRPPQTAADRVDLACDRFEAEWRAGHRPRIEDYLAEATEVERSVLLGELVPLELELRLSAGEEPTLREYRDRFPGHPQEIERAFGGLGSTDERRRRRGMTGTSADSDARSSVDFTTSRISGWEASLGVAPRSLRMAPGGTGDQVPDPEIATSAADQPGRRPPCEAGLGTDPVGSLERRLADSGLMSASEARAALDGIPGASGGGVEDQADELVGRGLLTRFQARALIRGHPRRLRLGHYALLEEIGRGGMGVVYRALDGERGIRVALKTLPRVGAREIYRFKREFRSRMGLSHLNLVNLFELVSDDEQWFFTMELVEGVDFLAYVRPPAGSRVAGGSDSPGTEPADEFAETWRAGRTLGPETLEATAGRRPGGPETGGGGDRPRQPSAVDLSRLRTALRQLAEGISTLHSAGKLHRDLKASNVLVTPGGRVVLLDFGLVTDLAPHRMGPPEEFDPKGPVVLDADRWKESQTLVAGTVGYMAPEQAAGGPLTAACDWYAMGVMLFEALTGRRPFTGPAYRVLRDKQLTDPPPPRALNPEAPEDLDNLCRVLLRRNPEDRLRDEDVLRRLRGTPGSVVVGRGDGRPPARRVPFVGREPHLAVLEEAYRAVQEGDATTVLVRGPSGAGKSTLVRQFLETLPAADRPVVLAGRCFEQESVPYKALDSLVDALGRYLRCLPGDEVEAILPRGVGALARIFPVLRRVPGVAGARWLTAEAPDPHELRRRAFSALRALLSRIGASRPLVLALDDLQWGDADSGALLAELLRPPDPPRLLLLACYRSEYAEKSPCLWALLVGPAGSAVRARRLPLEVEAMGPAEASRLALALIGREDPEARGIAELIARESGGNPYFISELVQHLGHGIGHATLSSAPSPAGPVALDEVLWARVRRLPEAPRRLLEVIAVAGRPLTQRLAFAAAALSGEATHADVPLRSGNLVRSAGPRLDDEIEPYHDRVRETVVARLDLVALRGHHRQLAATLEAAGGADPESLAVHFEGAGDAARAGPYYEIAAGEAAEALAFERAAALYRRALELLGPDEARRKGLLIRLADALANAGRGPEAAQQYLAAVERADRRETIELERRAAYQYCISGNLDEGEAVLRRVLRRVGMALPRTQGWALASLLFDRLRLRLRGLRFRERATAEIPHDELARLDLSWAVGAGLGTKHIIIAPAFQSRNLRLALRAGEPFRVARALVWEAALSGNEGRRAWRRTQALYEAARALADRMDDPYIRGMVELAGGILDFHAGRWPGGVEHEERAAAIFRERCTGVAWELGQAHTFLLWCMSWRGAYAEMHRRGALILGEAEDKGDRFTAANLGGYIEPLARLAQDDPEGALLTIRRSVGPWSRDLYHIQHFVGLMGTTHVHLYRGDPRAAYRNHLEQWPAMRRNLIHHAQICRVVISELRARAALALAVHAAEPASLVRDAGRRAWSLEQERVPHAAALALPIRAGIAAHRGDRTGAARHLAAAVAAFDALDMGQFAAAARLRLAALVGGDEGRALAVHAATWAQAQQIRDPARLAASLIPELPA